MKSLLLSKFGTSGVIVTAVVLAILPLVALVAVSITMSGDALSAESDRRIESIADLGASLIDEQLGGLGDLTASYARRPLLTEAVADGTVDAEDRQMLAANLTDLRGARPDIATAFIVDPDGLLLQIDPPTPSIIGRDFSFRDWYQGVTASGTTYISETYRSAAAGDPLVAATSTPVRSADGRTVAILVAGYDLSAIGSFVDDFADANDVRIEVLDQSGQRVAGPELVSTAALSDDQTSSTTAGARQVEARSDTDIAAAATAPRTGWTVVAAIDRADAYAGVDTLRSTVLAISAGLGATLLAGVTLLVLVLRDYRRNETRLVTAEATAMDASRLKSEFLANMSHEIRTPLNGVIGMTELLEGTPLSPVQREYVQSLQLSAEALFAIINDVLDLSKIEAGRLELDCVPFSPGVIVEEVASVLAPRAEQKGVEAVVAVALDVPDVVRGDGDRFRQIVTNLVANAVKFTAEGEIVLHLDTVSDDRGGVELEVSVDDTGIGIAPDALETIFTSFSQADASTTRRFGGTGLGLAISRQLVAAMGGEIGVSSEPGVGSRFWFRIPAEPVADGLPKKRSSLRDVRVLVVDDNATNRRVLEDNLRAWNMRPTVVDGGADALRCLDEAARGGVGFQLAILDLHMPDMDGLQLAHAIRADPRHDDVELVLLTSVAQAGQLRAARDAGIRARLTKPVRQSALYDRLAEVLGHLDAIEPRPEVVAETPEIAMPEQTTPRSKTILVAEDNEINRRVAVGMLERLGYDTAVASDGAEAVEAVRQGSFAAVLMDCQMPVMDGFEATIAIRAQEGDERIPIVALTASALKSDEDKCLAAGMDAYLTKPVTIDKLRSVLEPWTTPSAPPPSPNGADVLNRDLLDELAETIGTTGLEELIETFIDSGGQRIDDIEHALNAGDGARMHQLAHSLKGSASTFGANRLGRLAGHVEDLTADAAADAAAPVVADLREAMVETTTALRDHGVARPDNNDHLE